MNHKITFLGLLVTTLTASADPKLYCLQSLSEMTNGVVENTRTSEREVTLSEIKSNPLVWDNLALDSMDYIQYDLQLTKGGIMKKLTLLNSFADAKAEIKIKPNTNSVKLAMQFKYYSQEYLQTVDCKFKP